MSIRMQPEEIAALAAMIRDGNEYGHTEARKVANEYTWGWLTCWFAGTGQIDAPAMPDTYYADPVRGLMRAFFGWWSEGKDSTPLTESETLIAQGFRAYLERRVALGDRGPVWSDR
jgi:hypothetical protein